MPTEADGGKAKLRGKPTAGPTTLDSIYNEDDTTAQHTSTIHMCQPSTTAEVKCVAAKRGLLNTFTEMF